MSEKSFFFLKYILVWIIIFRKIFLKFVKNFFIKKLFFNHYFYKVRIIILAIV
jgi:hypothetical protein